MVRTQIQLPEEQVAMLKKMALAQHKSMAEIIRQAVDFFGKAQQEGERSSVEEGPWRLPGTSGPALRTWPLLTILIKMLGSMLKNPKSFVLKL